MSEKPFTPINRKALAASLTGTAVAVSAFTFGRYQKELFDARRRVTKLGSRIAETHSGPVEYTTFGDGPAVLVVHGILGGFDQGLLFAKGNIGPDFRSIIPSRFGYLRTPMPEGATVEAQADVYAALLDSLGIDRVAVVGVSAGSTSAIQFALRYPERVNALALVVPNSPEYEPTRLPPRQALEVAWRSDFLFWLLRRVFQPALKGMMGVPKSLPMTAALEVEIAKAMDTVLPVASRADGALFDMYVGNPDINSGYPFYDIVTPTLVISALDDTLLPHRNATTLAEMIPDAEQLVLDNCGHLLLGQSERVKGAIGAFVRHGLAREEAEALALANAIL